jgi:4-hydroxybenzoate polyprenyltransferase
MGFPSKYGRFVILWTLATAPALMVARTLAPEWPTVFVIVLSGSLLAGGLQTINDGKGRRS